MAYGDVFLQTSVPPIPTGAPQSPEAYYALIKHALAAHLDWTGLSPVRTSWCGRTDVPKESGENSTFVKSLLSETKIDPASVSFQDVPTTDSTQYCITSTSVWLCYGKLNPEWNDPNTANPFVFPVDLGAGFSVDVTIEFVVRWMQPLEGDAPTG